VPTTISDRETACSNPAPTAARAPTCRRYASADGRQRTTSSASRKPDVLTYVIGAPATFGFADRNGRPMGDNAPAVMFSMVTNSAHGLQRGCALQLGG
jgi:hypothetical protein